MNLKWHVAGPVLTPLVLVSVLDCGAPPLIEANHASDLNWLAQDDTTLTAQFFAPELGKGVDAAETRTYIKCVTATQTRKERLPFSKRLYQDYSVTSRQELDAKLDLSASASAKGLWGEGGGTVSYFKDKEFDADAFYWVVDANYELMHESLPTNDAEFGLTERAKSLLRTQGIQGFMKACGTHFYVGRTLGGRYVMLYEFRSHQDKFVDHIKSTARAKANFGLEGETELAHAIQAARRSAFMKVSTEVTGGDASLDAYASDPNLLKAELLKLRTALENGSGYVLDWEMVSYEVFEEFQQAERESGIHPIFDTARRDALELYYNTYTRNQQQMAELRAMLKRAEGDTPQVYYSPGKQAGMRAHMEKLQTQNNTIAYRARHCLSGSEARCDVDNLQSVPALPMADTDPDRDYTALAGWSVTPYLRVKGRDALDFFATPPDPKCHLRFFSTGNEVISGPSGVLARARHGGQRPEMLRIGTSQLLREGLEHYTPDICVGEFAGVCSLRLIEDFSHILDDGCPQPRLELSVFDDSGFCTDRLTFRMFL